MPLRVDLTVHELVEVRQRLLTLFRVALVLMGLVLMGPVLMGLVLVALVFTAQRAGTVSL